MQSTFFIFISSLLFVIKSPTPKKLTVLTLTDSTAKNVSDVFDRFKRIGGLNNLKIKVLTGQEKRSRLDLILNELRSREYGDDDVILFTERHDLLLLGHAHEILDRFDETKAQILISPGSHPCPVPVRNGENKSTKLNQQLKFKGAILIGFKSILVSFIQKLIDKCQFKCHQSITQLVTNKAGLFEFSDVQLDSDSILFHDNDAGGASSKFQLRPAITLTGPLLLNPANERKILIVFGNGPTGQLLNYYENKIINWEPANPCRVCREDTINLENISDSNLPLVTLAIFIDQPTPFLPEFFQLIYQLEYPKEKIILFVYNHVFHHNKIVQDFVSQNMAKYRQVKLINSTRDEEYMMKPWEARNFATNMALKYSTEYLFSITSKAHLDNRMTLKKLIEQNRGVVAPLLNVPRHLVGNFWMALNLQGFYHQSKDFAYIVQGKRRALWNVPFVSEAYLVHSRIFYDENLRPNFTGKFSPDKEFCGHNHKKGVFMYLNNQQDWGHLVSTQTYNESLSLGRQNYELYEYFSNQLDWQRRYMHPNWSMAFQPSHIPFQPCPDVFSFPLVTPRFCQELIEEMELYGNWSGTNDDDIDPAPTADIGLDQIDLEFIWIEFIREYVLPLHNLVHPNYMNSSHRIKWDTPYVIRYHADGRKILNPHHDRSIFTISVALNRAGVDFEGGGVRFNRYNCSILDNKIGWLLTHPGQLTHLHQGLVVTKGRRYVLITFINPH